MYLTDHFSVGGSFGVQKYDVKHYEDRQGNAGSLTSLEYTELSNTPELKFSGYLVVKPFASMDTGIVKNIKLIPSVEYTGSRYVDNYAVNATKDLLGSYTLVHIKASADITEYVSFSFSINNLFDELYEIAQYYPQAGRSFNLTLEGKY
jgi:outer membrane receptor protein involved in Fe transport